MYSINISSHVKDTARVILQFSASIFPRTLNLNLPSNDQAEVMTRMTTPLIRLSRFLLLRLSIVLASLVNTPLTNSLGNCEPGRSANGIVPSNTQEPYRGRLVDLVLT